jgi:CheY-like chemotaxis protein
MNSELDILLVEDNQDDMDLALHALRREKLANSIYVARDGEEALDFLFCRGTFARRSFDQPPKLVLLDLKLPKVDGLEVLKELKSDPRTKAIPVVIMTSSKEERDLVRGYNRAPTVTFRSRWISTSSARRSKAWDCTGW